jgi:hypothetical protein
MNLPPSYCLRPRTENGLSFSIIGFVLNIIRYCLTMPLKTDSLRNGQILCRKGKSTLLALIKMSATGQYPEHISLGSIIVLPTPSSLRRTRPFRVIGSNFLSFSHDFHLYYTSPSFINLNNIM